MKPERHETDDRDSSLRDSTLGVPQGEYELPRGNRRIAELAYRLMTEGQTPREQASAVAIGVFIGCIPLFGTHIFLVLAIASLTRLSRVRMYAATWISNPFFAPVLVWAELQVGHVLLTGRTMDHSAQQLNELGAAGLGWNLIVGTFVVGVTLAFTAAIAVWAWIPRDSDVVRRRGAIETAAHRYLDLGLLSWFQARKTLYGNPAIVDFVIGRRLSPSARFVDLGCGQGELLALVHETLGSGQPGRCIGITSRPQWAARARQVLPPDVEVVVADPGNWSPSEADSVVVWEARRRDAPPVDDTFIRRIRESLIPHGILVISWSATRLFCRGGDAFDHVIDGLEAEGFSIEGLDSSTAWFRRWNMIVARAPEL